jgi:hypothetical protein
MRARSPHEPHRVATPLELLFDLVPIAVLLACLWALLDRPEYGWTRAFGPVAAGLVLLTPFSAQPVLWTGITLAALVAIKLAARRGRA